jgi:hypothetical protein
MALTAVSIGALACGAHVPNSDASQRSAQYQVALDAWRRDSLVLDSIAGTVPIGALVTAYRKQVDSAEDPVEILHEIDCAETHILRPFGIRVLDHARLRARCVVSPTPEARSADLRRFSRRIKGSFFLDTSRCKVVGPRGPDSLAGIPVRVPVPKPVGPSRS